MSRTLVTPKPPSTSTIRGGNRKFHTLHFSSRVFTIQKNGTSIVSFRNKSDAIRFGKLLESHFELTHVWPEINFEDTLVTRTSHSARLKYIDMKNWIEKDLVDFCIQNGFSMLDIHDFKNDYKLVGQSLSWDCPMDMYVDLLKRRL